MGTVYRATDQVLGRDVAIKFLKESEPYHGDIVNSLRNLGKLGPPDHLQCFPLPLDLLDRPLPERLDDSPSDTRAR